jgi:L-threonylcarbamoyladenylate synthase
MALILYPTETIYALGALALDDGAIARLYATKGREEGKPVSWLVRDIGDIEQYARLDAVAASIAERFLPGPLTLVLEARPEIPRQFTSIDGTIGFRISSDPVAQAVIADVMKEYVMPLTCTSANVSGLPTLSTPQEILEQFGPCSASIKTVHDAGIRQGVPSTVVRVSNGQITVLREGAIASAILMR